MTNGRVTILRAARRSGRAIRCRTAPNHLVADLSVPLRLVPFERLFPPLLATKTASSPGWLRRRSDIPPVVTPSRDVRLPADAYRDT